MRRLYEDVKTAAKLFQPTFGLRGYPGYTLRINEANSYMSDGRVVLYTDRLMPDGTWACFAKGTPEELLDEACDDPKEQQKETA